MTKYHSIHIKIISIIILAAFLSTQVALGYEEKSHLRIQQAKANGVGDEITNVLDSSTSNFMHPNDIKAGLTPDSTIDDRDRAIDREGERIERSGVSSYTPSIPVAQGMVNLPVRKEKIHPAVYNAVAALNQIEGIKTYGSGPGEIYGEASLTDTKKIQLKSATRGLPIKVVFGKGKRFDIILSGKVKLWAARIYWDEFAKRIEKLTRSGEINASFGTIVITELSDQQLIEAVKQKLGMLAAVVIDADGVNRERMRQQLENNWQFDKVLSAADEVMAQALMDQFQAEYLATEVKFIQINYSDNALTLSIDGFEPRILDPQVDVNSAIRDYLESV